MNANSVIHQTKSLRDLVIQRLAPHTESQRIKHELRALGMSADNLWRTGSAYLTRLIEPGETLYGVVYELSDDGSTILVASNERVIFLDQKPLYICEDEIPYQMITGVSHSRFGEHLTVVLHTDVKDYLIRTDAQALAERFMRYVESRILQEQSHRMGEVGEE